jgi:hypothetical protein
VRLVGQVKDGLGRQLGADGAQHRQPAHSRVKDTDHPNLGFSLSFSSIIKPESWIKMEKERLTTEGTEYTEKKRKEETKREVAKNAKK